jgi:hypothetical protein
MFKQYKRDNDEVHAPGAYDVDFKTRVAARLAYSDARDGVRPAWA